MILIDWFLAGIAILGNVLLASCYVAMVIWFIGAILAFGVLGVAGYYLGVFIGGVQNERTR